MVMQYSLSSSLSSFIIIRSVVYMYFDNANLSIINNINKTTDAPIADSDQIEHPASLTIFFVVRFMGR